MFSRHLTTSFSAYKVLSTATRSKSSFRFFKHVPNVLSASRIAATPFIASWIINGQADLAVAGVIYCGASDMLDGWIARKYKLTSVLGSYLDPLADKLLVSSLVCSMAYTGSLEPLTVAALVVARDIALVGGTAILKMTEKSVEITPSVLSKVNTGLQFSWIAMALMAQTSMGPFLFTITGPQIVHDLGMAVGVTTVLSGVDYLVLRKGFKVSK